MSDEPPVMPEGPPVIPRELERQGARSETFGKGDRVRTPAVTFYSADDSICVKYPFLFGKVIMSIYRHIRLCTLGLRWRSCPSPKQQAGENCFR